MNFFFLAKILHFYDNKIDAPILPMHWAAFALFLGRVVDAFTDPYIGMLSDRNQNPLGRRKVFLIIAIPLLVFTFIFIWFPPIRSSSIVNFIYLLFMTNLYFMSLTLFAIPYDAHITEISKTKSERLTASKYKTIFAVVGIILASLLLGNSNMKQNLLILTGFSLITFLIALTGIKEKASVPYPNVSHRSFFKSIYKNKTFLRLCLIILFIEAAGNIFIKDIEYFTDHILLVNPSISQYPRDTFITYLYISFIVAMVLGLPFWNHLANRGTKIKALKLSMIYLMILFPGYYYIGYLPVFHFISPILYFAMVGFGYGAVNLMIIAILADVTDLDTNISGQKQEALYFGTYALIRKFGLALGLGVFSFLILIFDKLEEIKLGFRLVGPVICGLMLIAYFFLHRVEISEGNVR